MLHYIQKYNSIFAYEKLNTRNAMHSCILFFPVTVSEFAFNLLKFFLISLT